MQARGCQFRGLDAFPNLETQRKRFFQNVWEASWAVDMTTVYSRLPQHEVKRFVTVCMTWIALPNMEVFSVESNIWSSLMKRNC